MTMLQEIREITEKYEVIEKMAQGGMGAIYRVRHRILDEIRVIKTILPDQTADEESRGRFLREARVAAQLRHPNIATLFDCSIAADGTVYMVMEFIEGMNLYQFLQSGFSFSSEEVQSLGAQVLDALDYLHHQKVIHRDISTDNLMLTETSRGERQVKLIDLGLAKSLEHTDFKTKTGVLVGKVTYISPEQLSAGEAVLDARCDLYSFGIVLYEILTGEIPIVGKDQMSLMAGHLYHDPKSFEVTDPKGLIPPSMRNVILRALEKNPDDRYQSAREFKTALLGETAPPQATTRARPAATQVLGGPPAKSTSRPETEAESNDEVLAEDSSWKRLAAQPIRVAVLGAVLLVAVFVVVWMVGSGRSGTANTESHLDNVAALGSGFELPRYQNQYALVIGNNDYLSLPKLETAVNDAMGVSETLRNRYGFEVTELINATRNDLFDAMSALEAKVTARDTLLVYYAGHGEQLRNSEYWLFVDADPSETTQWVSTQNDVTQRLDALPAKHILVIADSCFAGASEGGNLLGTESPNPQDLVLRPSRLVLASGSNNPVLDTARGPNSIFASSLLAVLRTSKGPLEVGQIFEQISTEVGAKAREVGAEQRPSLATLPNSLDGGGGFFFLPPA